MYSTMMPLARNHAQRPPPCVTHTALAIPCSETSLCARLLGEFAKTYFLPIISQSSDTSNSLNNFFAPIPNSKF